jgi:hypothetical protein
MTNRINLEIKQASDDHVKLVASLLVNRTKSEVLKLLLDTYMTHEKSISPNEDIMNRIHDAVQAQMKVNETTTDTVKIGSGKQSRVVKFKQCAFSIKRIMTLAGVNQEPAKKYYDLHKSEIDDHHVKVLGIHNGDLDTFNRKQGQAAAIKNTQERAKLESEQILNSLGDDGHIAIP